MCNMYALSANRRITAKIIIDGRLRLGYSGHGICEYQDIFAYCQRALPSEDEPRLYSLQSKTIMAHIRVASIGEDRLVNCHPFRRVVDASEYVGMAQGKLPYFHKLETVFVPEGETDVERVFLHVLSKIQEQNFGDEWTPDNFRWLADLLRKINEDSGFNAVMSNGRYMFCFADKYSSGLYFTEIAAPFDDITLHDDCCKIEIAGEYNHAVRLVVVSSNPLSCHVWNKIPEGVLLVFRDGQLVFTSADDESDRAHRRNNQRVLVEAEIPMPIKSSEEIRHELNLFKNNLKLILSNEKRIFQKPELFHCRLHGVHFGSTTTGCAYLPVGVLLLLWRDGLWQTTCKHCGGRVYIFQAGGSLLSGRNSYSGRCVDCGRDVHDHAETIGVFARSALDIMKQHRNRRKYIRTNSQRFSWNKGIEGEPVDDEIIEAGVVVVDIETLINKLREVSS